MWFCAGLAVLIIFALLPHADEILGGYEAPEADFLTTPSRWRDGVGMMTFFFALLTTTGASAERKQNEWARLD